MQRYFVQSSHKDAISFTSEQEKHILKVMRMRVADRFYVVLSTGEAGMVEIQSIDPLTVKWIETINNEVEMPVFVTIACGLPKGDKLEWITQKATELGVHAIVPLETTYSIVKWDDKKVDKKIDRLQKIASEAAEQSHRSRFPKVEAVLSIKQLVQRFDCYTHILVAYEESAKSFEMSVFKRVVQQFKKGDHVLVIFGSEGGLSPEEISLLEKNGAICCAIGPRILRTETAPLYVLSAISYAVELKGE